MTENALQGQRVLVVGASSGIGRGVARMVVAEGGSLAVSARRAAMLDEAVAEHRTAIRLKPDLHEPHSNLGNALQAQGKLDEAIAAYRQAIALKPSYPEAYSNLGNALKDNGQLDEY